jgi:hypothetical protein
VGDSDEERTVEPTTQHHQGVNKTLASKEVQAQPKQLQPQRIFPEANGHTFVQTAKAKPVVSHQTGESLDEEYIDESVDEDDEDTDQETPKKPKHSTIYQGKDARSKEGSKTYLESAAIVLQRAGKPLHVKEIVSTAISEGRSVISGLID